MKNLKELKKTRLTLEEIEQFYGIEYPETPKIINKLLEENIIKPIKASKTNGKNPQLYKKYSLVKQKEDNGEYISEIKNDLFIDFDTSYYLSHIDNYKSDRENILKFSNYMKKNRKNLEVPASINERSFEIWGKEKFLKDDRGETIVKNLGIEMSQLNYYLTPEPFLYFSFVKNPNQRVLIIENKDTWYSIRKLMIDGSNIVLGVPIDTIIYRGGKTIESSIFEYEVIVEDYLKNPEEVLYWGDLDYEGIGIYERLKEKAKNMFDVKVFKPAYKHMLAKAINIKLPDTKDGQNKNISQVFLNQFEGEIAKCMKNILDKGLYIPQEIITFRDLKALR